MICSCGIFYLIEVTNYISFDSLGLLFLVQKNQYLWLPAIYFTKYSQKKIETRSITNENSTTAKRHQKLPHIIVIALWKFEIFSHVYRCFCNNMNFKFSTKKSFDNLIFAALASYIYHTIIIRFIKNLFLCHLIFFYIRFHQIFSHFIERKFKGKNATKDSSTILSSNWEFSTKGRIHVA